jgi:hypothetical protein
MKGDWRVEPMAVLLVAMVGSAAGHDWGPLTGAATQATGPTMASISTMHVAANDAGLSPPQLGPGNTIGSVPIYEFAMPNGNFEGFASDDQSQGFAIAFNTASWSDVALSPPIDISLVVKFVATAYHEIAHLTYIAWFNAWSAANPQASSNFASCIEALTTSEGESKGYDAEDNNPCNEAYANAMAAQRLCVDKLAVCTNDAIDCTERKEWMKHLDEAIADAKSNCATQAADCIGCQGPPFPPSYPGCDQPPCDCTCQEEEN